MKNIQLALLTLMLIIFGSCSEQTTELVVPVPETKMDIASLSGPQVQPGQLIVKFRHEPTAEDVRIYTELLGLCSMKRIFPHAGRFETRTRTSGLHLWYVIEYDKVLPTTRAAEKLSFFDDVQIIEPVLPVKRNTTATFRPLSREDMTALGASNAQSYFNDSFLSLQWNYNNTGSVNCGEKGADIRLFDAWKVNTGRPEVIVAVVDGGIDYTHVDLSANIWVNETERGGLENEDDDGNGYKDDIYGYNFVTGNAIEPTLHGTHVAGTIGAVNNNGIGVSGIAGGDGRADSGVRLMNCQIFIENEQEERSATNYYTAAAIKYGADNGAVISQNSWGFDLGTVSSTPAVIQEAIAYFISKAGLDENGNQEGPMRGGLVVFASSNDNTASAVYPACDDNVISVAAMGPDFKKATYSNYGTAVDLIAPGGEMSYDPVWARTGVLSTGSGWDGEVVAKNAYYYMDGTSMACPHVSGVAALIVSFYGVDTPGFTPDRLKQILYNSVYDIYEYNPGYRGMLGAGALDASLALSASGGMPVPPVLLKPMPNLAFTQIGESRTIALGGYFESSDPDDELTYSVSVSTIGIADYKLSGDILDVSSTAYGKTYITVTVISSNGLATEATFLLSCTSKTLKPDDRPGFWFDIGDGELH